MFNLFKKVLTGNLNVYGNIPYQQNQYNNPYQNNNNSQYIQPPNQNMYLQQQPNQYQQYPPQQLFGGQYGQQSGYGYGNQINNNGQTSSQWGQNNNPTNNYSPNGYQQLHKY